MSAGLPYLQKLRKTDLSEIAEMIELPDYEGLKKADLEASLDEYLRAHQSVYAKEDSLSEYYKRLGARSPAKKVTDVVKTEGEPLVKKVRRKTQAAVDPAAAATSDGEGSMPSLLKTPGRELARTSASFAQSVPLPPSPAAVTDAIDRQTRRFSASVSELYEKSQVSEYSDSVRDLLSSPLAINIIVLLVEAYGLRKEIFPGGSVRIPPIASLKADETTVYLPNLWLLLYKSFWAPFSLWSLTSVILPLTLAYFINIPLKTTHGRAPATRRAAAIQSTPLLQFDPVVFNVAKALIAYLVFAEHFTFLGLFQHFTIATVNESIPGGYAGMITGAGIAGLISLYEAILKK